MENYLLRWWDDITLALKYTLHWTLIFLAVIRACKLKMSRWSLYAYFWAFIKYLIYATPFLTAFGLECYSCITVADILSIWSFYWHRYDINNKAHIDAGSSKGPGRRAFIGLMAYWRALSRHFKGPQNMGVILRFPLHFIGTSVNADMI